MGNLSQSNQTPKSTQPGHLSVGRRNEYRPKVDDALQLGVKEDMVLFAVLNCCLVLYISTVHRSIVVLRTIHYIKLFQSFCRVFVMSQPYGGIEICPLCYYAEPSLDLEHRFGYNTVHSMDPAISADWL